MPSLRQVRRRIRSVQNTGRVTKAMELVAASKMRRAQQRVVQGRPYAAKLREVMAHLASALPPGDEESVHPLMQVRPVRKVLVIEVAPDRGLCGGLVANINRRTAQFIIEKRNASAPASVVAVGRKARDFTARTGQDVKAVFVDLGDYPSLLDTLPIARIAMDMFIKGEVDEVCLAFTELVSAAIQRPTVMKLLPIEAAAEAKVEQRIEYIYEPNAREVYGALLPRFIEMQIYHGMLESKASEQAARMVAMRNASDNAKEVITELTLLMNKVRQNTITGELLDIVGAVAAVS